MPAGPGVVLDGRELGVTPPGGVLLASKDTSWWPRWQPDPAIGSSR